MPRSTALRALYRSGSWGFRRRPRGGMTASMSRYASQARKARCHRPGPRSGRAEARRSRLPPKSEPGCGRGAGRPSRAGARDGPVDPPGWGSGCRSRPDCGPARAPPLSLGARPPHARARARSGCPAARRTYPAWPADGPAGAARCLGCTRPPNGHRRVPLPVRGRPPSGTTGRRFLAIACWAAAADSHTCTALRAGLNEAAARGGRDQIADGRYRQARHALALAVKGEAERAGADQPGAHGRIRWQQRSVVHVKGGGSSAQIKAASGIVKESMVCAWRRAAAWPMGTCCARGNPLASGTICSGNASACIGRPEARPCASSRRSACASFAQRKVRVPHRGQIDMDLFPKSAYSPLLPTNNCNGNPGYT